MNITDTCSCGARFEASSRWSGGVVEQHRDWLTSHLMCRAAAQYGMVMGSKKPAPPERDERDRCAFIFNSQDTGPVEQCVHSPDHLDHGLPHMREDGYLYMPEELRDDR